MSFLNKIIVANELTKSPQYRKLYQKSIFKFFNTIGWPPRGCHLPLEPLDFDDYKELMAKKAGLFDNIFIIFINETNLNVEEYLLDKKLSKYCKLLMNGRKFLYSSKPEIWDSLSSRARNTIRKSMKKKFLITCKKLSDCEKRLHQLLSETSRRKKYAN